MEQADQSGSVVKAYVYWPDGHRASSHRDTVFLYPINPSGIRTGRIRDGRAVRYSEENKRWELIA